MKKIALAAAMLSMAHMPPKVDEYVFGYNGNSYPINNRKGFAAKQKRAAKKSRGK